MRANRLIVDRSDTAAVEATVVIVGGVPVRLVNDMWCRSRFQSNYDVRHTAILDEGLSSVKTSQYLRVYFPLGNKIRPKYICA